MYNGVVNVNNLDVYETLELLEACDELNFNELIEDKPESLLNSNDMVSIEKSMLITILKKDDLGLGEINIWDHVIQWGIGQNQELRKDISEWNKEDYKILKDILEDIIPLIRFNEINSKDFFRKITPFKRIFI